MLFYFKIFQLFFITLLIFPQDKNLPNEIKKYINKKEKLGSRTDEFDWGDGYTVYKHDLNDDNIQDILLDITIYEGRYPKKQFISVFLNEKNKYTLVSEMEFTLNRYIAGGMDRVEIIKVSNKTIEAKVVWFGESDPNCCPSIMEQHIIKFKNNKLFSEKPIDNMKFFLPKIGRVVEAGYFMYKVNSISFMKEIKNNFETKRADGIYLMVNLSVLNVSRETRTLTSSLFNVYDSEGYVYEPAENALQLLFLNDQYEVLLLKDFPPKIKKEVSILFEVPTKEDVYLLEVNGGFSTGITKKIKLK